MAESGGLVLPVKDGKVEESALKNNKKKVKNNGEMGKDEFLQLLVAQMKYQDPLQPTSNTEYVSQLATFSSLEQMQNLNQTSVNSQAFTLIGQEVVMRSVGNTGLETYTQGKVEYVSVIGNKAYLYIEGKPYEADDLYSVVGEGYIASQKGPKVAETALKYDHAKPEDLSVEITLGEEEYQASMVAVFINGETVDNKYLKYEDGKITISSEAFKKLDAGKYKLGFIFNDINTTTYSDKVTLQISGDKPPVEEAPDTDGEGGTDDSEKDGGAGKVV